jgi:V8-like Glu-specific endopeptidase
LRNALAGLYWTLDESRRIAVQIGLNPIFVHFSPKPVNTWMSILEEAHKQELLQDLIAAARAEYPKVQILELAQKNLLTGVDSGEISPEEWKSPGLGDQLEKIIGQSSTLRPIRFLEGGLVASRSVCRVVLADQSSGTGFLTTDNFLVTSHHVIRNVDDARDARVEFNYQKTLQDSDAASESYTLIPDKGFFTSPTEEENGDDWTVVRVQGSPNERWGSLSIHPTEPKIHQEVVIIQHPGGGDKQIALSHNLLVYADKKRLQYLTDTLSGSSGSPVFNEEWQVIGIHHKGGWLREPGSKAVYFRNQAILINVVAKHFESMAASV